MTKGLDSGDGESPERALPPEPTIPPEAEDISGVFDVYEVRTDGETRLYIGDPIDSLGALQRTLPEIFQPRGYTVTLQRGYRPDQGPAISRGEYVVVAEPQSTAIDGIPWVNIGLFLATVASTLFAGAVFWYQIPLGEEPWRIVEAWPFTLAILGVLGCHEFGHYALSRYHGVSASLPYFIPVPTYIGSFGAVIRMKGRIPTRKALFDIGVAGPLAGLVATIVVTAVGLQLDPLPVQQAAHEASGDGTYIVFNNPPLLEIVAAMTGRAARLDSGVVHPVVFGGWVGMLVTLLNMLPVGQLDGGHILRAMAGAYHRLIARLVPFGLFSLAAGLLVFRGFDSVPIWILWGFITLGLSYAGPADPIEDDRLDTARLAVGFITFALAILCFTPVPVEIIEAT